MQGRWTVKADLSGFLRIAAEGGNPSASDSEDDSILSHSLREGRCEGTTQRGGAYWIGPSGLNGPRWMELKDKTFPALSSRNSQGEG